MSCAFFGAMVRTPGKSQGFIPVIFAAPPDITVEDMLEQALWLKQNGYRIDLEEAFVPSATATVKYGSGKRPGPKATPETEAVYIPKGLRQRRLLKQRRLQEAFLCYHDPANWPVLRTVLLNMGRDDLIGPGGLQLVPAAPSGAAAVHEAALHAV